MTDAPLEGDGVPGQAPPSAAEPASPPSAAEPVSSPPMVEPVSLPPMVEPVSLPPMVEPVSLPPMAEPASPPSDLAIARAAARDLRRARLEGVTLGGVTGPAAGFAAAWSGIGDARLHTAILATAFAATLGAFAWPAFAEASGPPGRRGVGFSALFAAACGLLGGGLAAFPLGGVAGALAGALGGATAAAVWRAAPRLGRGGAGAVAAIAGAGAALGATALWLG